jgi:hypothetical protein
MQEFIAGEKRNEEKAKKESKGRREEGNTPERRRRGKDNEKNKYR